MLHKGQLTRQHFAVPSRITPMESRWNPDGTAPMDPDEPSEWNEPIGRFKMI